MKKAEPAEETETETRNRRFETPPEAFRQIDFRNFSYPYRFRDGRKGKIPLEAGQYRFEFKPWDRGWFDFGQAYYLDLTNDGNPEALVLLGHVSCGVGSCDGGAYLFYLYTIKHNHLKLLWRYETGDLAGACGLKSLIVKDQKITMELFGRCFAEIEKSMGLGKFQVKDTTRLTFGFKGGKMVQEKKEFIAVPERNVMNYRPEISIDE